MKQKKGEVCGIETAPFVVDSHDLETIYWQDIGCKDHFQPRLFLFYGVMSVGT